MSQNKNTQPSSKREQNRQRMPKVAAFVDEYRAVFGEVKVKWASENGHTIGKRDD